MDARSEMLRIVAWVFLDWPPCGFSPEFERCRRCLNRIKFSVHDHGFAYFASAAKTFRLLRSCVRGQTGQQRIEFLIEHPGDELRRMLHRLALLILDANQVAMQHALRKIGRAN